MIGGKIEDSQQDEYIFETMRLIVCVAIIAIFQLN